VEIVKRNIASDEEKMQENSGDLAGKGLAEWSRSRARTTPVALSAQSN
jgi:hypothetical protein